MDDISVLPCKCCGNRPWLEPLSEGRWSVECDYYGCDSLYGAIGNSKLEAIENWNKMQSNEKEELSCQNITPENL